MAIRAKETVAEVVVTPEDIAEVKVDRVYPHVVDSLAPRLVPFIAESWGVPENVALRWMYTWALDGQFSFVHAGGAVGVAQLITDPMALRPRVEEVFLDVSRGAIAEGLAIYKHWVRWAKSTNARGFSFGYAQPLPGMTPSQPRAEIRKLFPNMARQSTWYVKLDE